MIPTFRDRLSLFFMLFIWLVIAIAIIGHHLRNILGGVEMWTTVLTVVKPSEFLSILPINENIGQGMTGYYLGQKAYQLLYTIDFIRQNLWAKSDKVPDFIKSPDSYQRLEPWTEEDLHRLGIHHILRPNLKDNLDEETID